MDNEMLEPPLQGGWGMTEMDTERLILAMRASGMKLSDIAVALERSGIRMALSTIWRICSYANVRRPPLNAGKRNKARAMAMNGSTLAETAEALAVSVTTVQRWCRDLGLKRGRKTPLPNGIFAKGLTKR